MTVKRLTQWRPRPGVDHDDAMTHWVRDHAPLVRAVPGVQRYVQNVCVTGPDGRPAPYAGLGEVWFDDEADAPRRSPRLRGAP